MENRESARQSMGQRARHTNDFFLIGAWCMLLEITAMVVSAQPIALETAENQVSLLELYTSEGCNSCPPAETWLSELKTSPKLWRTLVPVAFHVDYWDSLGWKDRFGSKEYSERQRAYGDFWKSRSVYTPGFVLDGSEWKGWFHHETSPPAASKRAGVLRASSADGVEWTLSFRPVASPSQSRYEFHATLLGFDLASHVTAGENRGRELAHDFVVLKLVQAQARVEGGVVETTVHLDSRQAAAPRLGLAVWVEVPNHAEPLQALGGWIPPFNPGAPYKSRK
jgi:hypothetical protein